MSNQNDLYIIDIERSEETVRLLGQDELMTTVMGGLFPENVPIAGKHILDVACGPGGWARRVAFGNPTTEVTGVDINPTMISYANELARVSQLMNAHFYVIDVTHSLSFFADDSFDIINGRFMMGFLTPKVTNHLLRECLRILRPGGLFRWTEAELGFTSSAAHEQYIRYMAQAFYQSGRSYSPDGYHMGLLLKMLPLLRSVGFIETRKDAYAIEISHGTEMHKLVYQDLEILIEVLHPFLMQQKIAEPEKLRELYQQVLTDNQSPDYHGINFLLSAWGEKKYPSLFREKGIRIRTRMCCFSNANTRRDF